MKLLEQKVQPKRMLENREAYRKYWWRHGERRVELYKQLATAKWALVCSQTSKYRTFARVSARMVFSTKVAIVVDESWSMFSVVQSNTHGYWALFFGSTLEDRPVYTPSDCFETFPFPENWQSDPKLESAGQAYHDFRAALMIRNNEGLTKTYNRFHDPDETSADILMLRELHAEMDRAVLDAYGWTDIQPTCAFLLDYEEEDDEDEAPAKRRKKKPWRYRWPDEIRDEVLARLLELNAHCAVVGSDGTVMGLWCSLAKRPLKLPSGLCYRLDYLEVHPSCRGGSLGLFVLALVASRSLEIGCDGLVLTALPEQKLCDFYVRAGGKRLRPKGWNCQPGLIPFQFDTERLRYLKELADAHVDEGEETG